MQSMLPNKTQIWKVFYQLSSQSSIIECIARKNFAEMANYLGAGNYFVELMKTELFAYNHLLC